MPASNVFTLGIAKQTAKGAIATAPEVLTRVTGSDLQPVRDNARIEETGTGRDGGDRFTSRVSVSGGADFVLRPEIAPIILEAVLGSSASAGGTTTLTPADDQPYYTIWRYLAGTLIERFEDCKVPQAVISGAAGQLIGCSATVMGTLAARLNVLPAGWTEATLLANEFPFRVPGADYTIEAVRNRAIRDFSLTINAAQTAIQTDMIHDSFIEPGLRTIELNYTEVFQDRTLYDKIQYGAAGGTTLEEDVYHGTWQATFGDYTGADGPGLRFVIPNFAFLTAPLAPDPGGDPLQMAVTGAADRPTGGGAIITATVVEAA